MSILVVEDNSINAKLLLHNLTIGGYDTHWAVNGCQALEFLSECQDIRLVISDIMMPEMDGLEFLGRLKEHPDWKKLPVIMCTSLSDLNTVKKAVQEGCQSYIVKPVQSAQLMQKVHDILGPEKTILENRTKVMDELGLSAKAYDDILAAFIALVDDTVAILEKKSRNGGFNNVAIDLPNLSERADLLGAHKLGAVIDRVADLQKTGSTKTRETAYTKLLIELKRLKVFLLKS
jgi:CheY-like chemotaxis protein